jgi:acyl dehydratase
VRVISSIQDAVDAVGQELGVSQWVAVDQDRINAFADTTGDHQWIHVDVERAKETPFGGTIAHGYFTLSLIPALSRQVFGMEGFTFALNYGLNRVRFPSPMPVGQKVRCTVKVAEVQEIPGGVQTMMEMTLEREGGEKPVCVAETLVRAYG